MAHPNKAMAQLWFVLMHMQLLQRVSDVEVQAENTARQQELDRQRALDMLPGTFDVLRGVFGDKGPCVKPKTEVSWCKVVNPASGLCSRVITGVISPGDQWTAADTVTLCIVVSATLLT